MEICIECLQDLIAHVYEMFVGLSFCDVFSILLCSLYRVLLICKRVPWKTIENVLGSRESA